MAAKRAAWAGYDVELVINLNGKGYRHHGPAARCSPAPIE
jgi:hypothetical protein